GDQRGLEVRGTDRPEVFNALRKLERALDVVPRSLEVPLTLPAARAPREDVRLESVARQARALGEPKRFVEERKRRLHAAELVAAAAEPEQHVRPLHVGEGLGLGDRSRLVEELDRRAMLTDSHLRETRAGEGTNLQLRHAGRPSSDNQRLERLSGLAVLLCLVQRLGAREG